MRVGKNIQRIGISATLGNPKRVMKFLAPNSSDFKVVEIPSLKQLKLALEFPTQFPSNLRDFTKILQTTEEAAARFFRLVEIIKQETWDKIFIICEQKPNNFPNAEFIIINPNQYLSEMAEEVKNKLQGKINDIEIALNVISGQGKMHMAILSALLKLGLGIRLVALTKNGVREI